MTVSWRPEASARSTSWAVWKSPAIRPGRSTRTAIFKPAKSSTDSERGPHRILHEAPLPVGAAGVLESVGEGEQPGFADHREDQRRRVVGGKGILLARRDSVDGRLQEGFDGLPGQLPVALQVLRQLVEV